MAPSVKHKFTSSKADSGDASIVRPSNWNDEHAFTMGSARLLGRAPGAAGVVQEISLSADLAFNGTVLGLSASIANKANKATLVSEQPTLTVTGFTGVTYVPVNNVGLNNNGKIPVTDLLTVIGTVPKARKVNTGVGLQGGGDLTVDRTHSLIMEASTLTDVTENVATATGHTHDVDTKSIASAGIAQFTSINVGTFCLLRQSEGSPKQAGEELAGSNLNFASCDGSAGGTVGSGTWQCQGRVTGDADTNTPNNVTLWMRVS